MCLSRAGYKKGYKLVVSGSSGMLKRWEGSIGSVGVLASESGEPV
jgi:hypothetical protein